MTAPIESLSRTASRASAPGRVALWQLRLCCGKEIAGAVRALAAMDGAQREIIIDDFCFELFEILVKHDGWPDDEAGEFARDLRRYIEMQIEMVARSAH